ncbi:MAG: hypothetical protein JO250_18785 [Armatimonadetes bacterium]|nr:hypothetical protein [Armatimonadota bacterium]
MNKRILAGMAALSFGLAAGVGATPLASQSHPYQDNSLSKIGKAAAYPVKKAAGNGSKAINHGGKAVAYPIRKAGVNASKTAHKTVHKIAPKKKK